MSRRPARLLAALLVAAALLVTAAAPAPPGSALGGLLPAGTVAGPLAALGPATASAATPDLTLVTDARYVVQPDKARVHLVVDITATNRKADTTTRRYLFDSAYLAVLPGTKGFAITSDGLKPSVRVRSTSRTYTVLAIAFGTSIGSGESLRLRLQFDLPDPGGSPTRVVRVGPSLVSFPVWAFATDGTPGSSVTVIFPAGYTVTAQAGTLPPATTSSSGSLVYRTGPLDKPLGYYLYLSADQPATLVDSSVRTRVGSTAVDVTLRGWADDPAWAERVGGVFGTGLPVIAGAIGLPYPAGDPLVVKEAASRTTGGYAGLFDASTRTVEVAYYADSFVALHEAAHVWFNGSLLSDRWANEAFASYYAAEAAQALGLKVTAQELTPELVAAAIPLNAWGAVGQDAATVEDYGYAASYRLATLIAERAGPGVLRAVWQAAVAREAAYQPIDPTLPHETSAEGAPDWRVLLDLLEERTGVAFTDLWARWVVRPEDEALLVARSTARTHYEETVRAAGDWELPAIVRQAMDAWRFDQAQQLLGQADAALAGWRSLEAVAAARGLSLPGAVKSAFEGTGGPAAALDEIAAEQAAVEAIGTSAALATHQRGPFETIGLLGERPDAELVAARGALAAGDAAGAVARAEAARATWLGADDLGRRRVASTLFGVLVVGGTLAVVVAAVVRRRRERRVHEARQALVHATPIGRMPSPGGPAPRSMARFDAVGRYGTLGSEPTADEPSPRSSDEVTAETGDEST